MLSKFGEMADKMDDFDGNIAQKTFDVTKKIYDGLKKFVFKGWDKVSGASKAKEIEKFTKKHSLETDASLKATYISNYGEAKGTAMYEAWEADFKKKHPNISNQLSSNRGGTYGFENFGSGTPAMLHGSEMVIPEANAAKIVKDLVSTVNTTGTTGQIANASDSNGIREMISLYTKSLEATETMNRSLNTLVTIGAMTEKNTKTTNNELANMGGSLV